jgi:hypothetical protein
LPLPFPVVESRSNFQSAFKTLIMAINNSGITGNFTGTIGPITGFIRNGKNIIRSSSSAVKNQRTPLQLAQREKISICTRFVKAFSGTGFLNKSFPAYRHGGTGYNRAVSALMSRALTGVYPDIALSYAQVLISKGRLPGPQNAKAVKKANNTIQFTFADNSTTGIAAPDDTVILVAYAPTLQQAIFTVQGGFRKDKKAVLNVAALKGQAVETWIGFLSAEEKDASDSVWAGKVVV